MSGRKLVTRQGMEAYLYDGGLKGFYCCVHACVYSGELPLAILPAGAEQPTLLPHRQIATDEAKALRVRHALRQKASPRVQELIETAFLSCMQEKELPMLRCALLGFERGSGAINMMQHPDVAALLKAERHLRGEAHLLTGFVRFSDVGGRLIASIRPKNFVLPFLAEHFVERFSQETFLIYDRTNHAALLHEAGRAEIVPLEAMPEWEDSQEELLMQALWKQFYHTIGIASRENPRCRMSHMPKRYWAEMTEMRELL